MRNAEYVLLVVKDASSVYYHVVVVRCAVTAQGEKRSRLGGRGRCVYLLRQGCNSPGPAR